MKTIEFPILFVTNGANMFSFAIWGVTDGYALCSSKYSIVIYGEKMDGNKNLYQVVGYVIF